MTEHTTIEQRASIGATSIGVQNNYNGLSPMEACNLATNLFYENFPKLQEYAKGIIETKMKELMEAIADKLQSNHITDMGPFGEPDVQYALYEAQKGYARLGTQEMLDTLSNLVVSRIQHNHDSLALRVSIDKAIEIAPMLNSEQLDFLSILFMCCEVCEYSIKTTDDLKAHIDKLSSVFKKADFSSTYYLNMLGCLQLCLHDTDQWYAERYHFALEDVQSICTDIINKTTGDYTTSHIGTILAIANIDAKMGEKLDPSIWIR